MATLLLAVLFTLNGIILSNVNGWAGLAIVGAYLVVVIWDGVIVIRLIE